MPISIEQKRELYAAGKYVFTTPGVTTQSWTDEDWINYIDARNGWQLLPDSDKWNEPMVNLSFWAWLDSNKENPDIKRGAYLEVYNIYMVELGLIPGVDFLNEPDRKLLKTVFEHWWYIKIKPTL